MNPFYILLALGAGLGIATQAAINSQLSKDLQQQPLVSAFISFFIGTVVLFVVVCFKSQFSQIVSTLPHIPLWKFIGGILGAFFVSVSILLAPKMGLANMLFFIIVGQLCSAVVIDHFGWFNMPIHPISLHKLIGLIIMCFGIMIFFFGGNLLKK